MSTIDIRTYISNPITEIVFADGSEDEDFYIGKSLTKVDNTLIRIESEGSSTVIAKSTIDSLIKALQKAKEVW